MRSISAGQSSNAIARGGAQPVCLFLSTTGTCPTRLRSWFGRCQIARASMPLPSNRQQAVAKALCPRGSLPDPPSGGSGVPERGIPLVCWSYALVPETYLGQRDDALCSKGASCKFKRDHLPRKGASTRLGARHPQVLGHQSRARASASVFAFR